MNIAINARFLQKRYMEGYGNFILQTAFQLFQQLPQHQYFLILDQEFDLEIDLPNNCKTVVVKPKTKHPVLAHYWMQVKIPRALKKNKIDCLLSFDGTTALFTKKIQAICVHDLAFLHHPNTIAKKHLWYYKYYTPKFLQKAAHIFTVSNFSKNDIIEKYSTDPAKISVLYNGVKPVFVPLTWGEQNLVRGKYTDDASYFMYCGSIHPRKNIINLLKAFSVFKKWQKSNMKLVLVGRLAWKNNAFTKLLETYKHRQDVVLLEHCDDTTTAQLMASAYALVYPSLFEGFGVPIIEAMQCNTPVLCSNNSGMQEAGGNAALFFNATNIEDIAAKMQLIYKDESLRSKLQKAGKTHAVQFDWKNTVAPLVKWIENM